MAAETQFIAFPPRSVEVITNIRTPLGVQGLVGGHTMPADAMARAHPPRHAGRMIEPDGRYAAEERGGGWKSVKIFQQPYSIDTSCRVVGSFRLCSFSLRLHKENEPKEMRFAAVQIPAKIGSRSLNGENLMYSTACRTSSDSSPFFTLTHRRFLHAVICKAARDARLPCSFHAITNIRTPLGVQGLVGGHTMPADAMARAHPPRHAGRMIEPDGRYAAEERGGGWKSVKIFQQPYSIDTSCRVVGSFRLCSFSLRLHKENEPKEMRFAAVQIPAKIGSRSLNGENLMYSTACRTSSDSSPFFTLTHRRFLHAVICKAARDARLPCSFHAITNIRTPLGVQGLVGGHTMPADAWARAPTAARWQVDRS